MSLNPLGKQLAHCQALAVQTVEDKVALNANTSRLRHSIKDSLSSPAVLSWCFAAGTFSGAGGADPEEDDDGFSVMGLAKKVGGTYLLGQLLGD